MIDRHNAQAALYLKNKQPQERLPALKYQGRYSGMNIQEVIMLAVEMEVSPSELIENGFGRNRITLTQMDLVNFSEGYHDRIPQPDPFATMNS